VTLTGSWVGLLVAVSAFWNCPAEGSYQRAPISTAVPPDLSALSVYSPW
jgi:hypothetical protein